jgi:hypothetical protein
MRAPVAVLKVAGLMAVTPMLTFGVLAVLQDSEGVATNTFSTAATFQGTRLVQSGTLTSSGIGLVSDTLPEAVVAWQMPPPWNSAG